MLVHHRSRARIGAGHPVTVLRAQGRSESRTSLAGGFFVVWLWRSEYNDNESKSDASDAKATRKMGSVPTRSHVTRRLRGVERARSLSGTPRKRPMRLGVMVGKYLLEGRARDRELATYEERRRLYPSGNIGEGITTTCIMLSKSLADRTSFDD